MTNNFPLQINSERLHQDFIKLSEIGATMDGGVTRLALSNEDMQAREYLARCFDDFGFKVFDDDAGNLSGVLACDNPQAKTLLLGSHLDTVPDGGCYDGTVGIIAALECMRVIKESKIRLPFHLELVDFTDEEGCWQSLFGSRALTGILNQSYLTATASDYGSFRAALFRAGIHPLDVPKARRDPATILGYLELHIEQGQHLDDSGLDIGIVTTIVGRMTYNITFYGEASHSGTTARNSRRNALLGASRYIVEAYRYVEEHFYEGIFNSGNLKVSPGAFNIIPDKAVLTVEFRHVDEEQLYLMEKALIELAQTIAFENRLAVEARKLTEMPIAHMDKTMIATLDAVSQSLNIQNAHMVSYAGHDAQIMSQFTPSGMIFIPSVGGISHSPKEFTQWNHVVSGTTVLLNTILHLANNAT